MSYKIIEEKTKDGKVERHTYRRDIVNRDRALHIAEERQKRWREKGDDRKVVVRIDA